MCNVAHQRRCVVEIPVCARYMGMSHVGGESQHVAGNPVSRIWTCHERFDGKSVTQVVKMWLWPTFHTFDTGCIKNQMERLGGNGIAKRMTTSVRDKDVLIISDYSTSQGEVLIESGSDAIMKLDQSTLTELGFTNQ